MNVPIVVGIVLVQLATNLLKTNGAARQKIRVTQLPFFPLYAYYLLVNEIVKVIVGHGLWLPERQTDVVLTVHLQQYPLQDLKLTTSHFGTTFLSSHRRVDVIDGHAQETLPRFALVRQVADRRYVTVLVENLGTLVTAHQLPTVQAHGTPVLVWVILLTVFVCNRRPKIREGIQNVEKNIPHSPSLIDISVELCTNGEVVFVRPSGSTCTPFESNLAMVTIKSFIDSAHSLSIESESLILSLTLGLGVLGIVEDTLGVDPELMTITLGGPCLIRLLKGGAAGGDFKLILNDPMDPLPLPPFIKLFCPMFMFIKPCPPPDCGPDEPGNICIPFDIFCICCCIDWGMCHLAPEFMRI